MAYLCIDLTRTAYLPILKIVITAICISVFTFELIKVIIKGINQDSYQLINHLEFDYLKPPSITLCPGQAWKASGPFLNEYQFKNSTYSMEEIFHPLTLNALQNKSLFIVKEQYASYYGLCFTMEKLTPEHVSDYSFQIVVNASMDYNYYLHEPYENEWLFMSVYPYEVPINYINANNNDHIGGADIIIQKEIIKRIPGKGNCDDISINHLCNCWKDRLARALRQVNITCKIPALRFTRFNINHLNDCKTKDAALEVEDLVYKLAQKNLNGNVCGKICTLVRYRNVLNLLSDYVLSKELKKYGDGYFIIWSFYSSLHVEEKVEQYVFDFDSSLVAIGGSLGLFLGWSMKSILLHLIEYIHNLLTIKNV